MSKYKGMVNNPIRETGEGTTEMCYSVTSPAGTLTVLYRNRNSSASLTPGWPLPGPPQ